jgi:hypothetical protein
MSLSFRLSLSVGVICLIAFAAFAPRPAPAQAAQAAPLEPPEKVRFETADGVKIHGTFYRSNAKGAPAVIMLHNIKESSSKEKWIELAKTLQPSFSVLTFDFRGHGNSVDIDPTLYLRYPHNQRITKGANINKTKLEWKDIDKGSYTVFINDIAAAKSYLERTKNDLGLCNTQNTIVIGAEEGATLGAIWVNSEWYRYKIDFAPPFFQIRPENRPEGQYISALVSLSISPKLGSRTIDLPRTLSYPCKTNAVPALFICGEGDPKDKESLKDKKTADDLVKAIKFTNKKADPKLTYTRAAALPGAGKLKGVDLLLKSLKTADDMHGYLKTVVEENPQEWTQRDFLKSKYAWKLSLNPNVPPIPAKVYNQASPFPPNPLFPPGAPLPDAVEKNLVYDTYQQFAP